MIGHAFWKVQDDLLSGFVSVLTLNIPSDAFPLG